MDRVVLVSWRLRSRVRSPVFIRRVGVGEWEEMEVGWRLRGRDKLWEMGDGCFFFCVVFFCMVLRCGPRSSAGVIRLRFFLTCFASLYFFYSKEMRLTYLLLFWFSLASIRLSLFSGSYSSVMSLARN